MRFQLKVISNIDVRLIACETATEHTAGSRHCIEENVRGFSNRYCTDDFTDVVYHLLNEQGELDDPKKDTLFAEITWENNADLSREDCGDSWVPVFDLSEDQVTPIPKGPTYSKAKKPKVIKHMTPTLNNRGSLITYVNRGKETCLGYLLCNHPNGVFDATLGKVDITKEESETHNKLLSAAEIKGLDEQCQLGQGNNFYINDDKVTTWIGEEVGTLQKDGKLKFFMRGNRKFLQHSKGNPAFCIRAEETLSLHTHMHAIDFPEANTLFRRPSDMTDKQCRPARAYSNCLQAGSCAGHQIVVVAWQPTEEEKKAIAEGAPIFLSCIGGLPPHFLSTSFAEAANPQ